jgi:hypothetical protein
MRIRHGQLCRAVGQGHRRSSGLGHRGPSLSGGRRYSRRRIGPRRNSFPFGGRIERAWRRRCGQEQQRIEVALLLARRSNPEIHVRVGQLGRPAGTDGPHRVALRHGGTAPNPDRAEVKKRDRIAVGCLDRDRLAAVGNAAREGHPAGRRCDNRRPCRRADVDPAVLPRCVRMDGIERERGQHRSAHRPGPAERGSRNDECGHNREDEQAHRTRPPLSGMQTQ